MIVELVGQIRGNAILAANEQQGDEREHEKFHQSVVARAARRLKSLLIVRGRIEGSEGR